jgi:hypothetical protein
MIHATKALSDQALKAYYSLLSLFERVKFDIKTKLYLFDCMVAPILLYGSEVWGVYNFKDIEKIHIKFCKSLLGVKAQTPNYAVYGELGRFPLYLVGKERAIKFWLKIKKNVNSPIHNIYTDQVNSNYNNWSKRMFDFVNNLGFPFLHYDFNVQANYYPILKQRIRDQFIQNWHEGINSMSKLEYYRMYKTVFGFEDYLSIVKNERLCKLMACFRLCSHTLAIETGRYTGTTRNQRICQLCTQNVVESEFHFLLCCSRYSDIRSKYFKLTSWPTKIDL